MLFKILHRFSGICICVFVGIHLANHLWSVFGVKEHIEMMNKLRVYYRNPVAEILLITSIVIQIISGINLFINNKEKAKTGIDKLQLCTGLYLLVFLFIHLTAVFGTRLFLHLDTNFYFGVAGINTFPLNLFFIPYYAMAVISFFCHIAAIHAKKMQYVVYGIKPTQQAKIIITIGMVITFVLFFGLTNKFKGVEIPEPYRILSK